LKLGSQRNFFKQVTKELGIKSEGGESSEVVRRGPYQFKN
jgi:hypothetical protein